jgi:hypothetical protein
VVITWKSGAKLLVTTTAPPGARASLHSLIIITCHTQIHYSFVYLKKTILQLLRTHYSNCSSWTRHGFGCLARGHRHPPAPGIPIEPRNHAWGVHVVDHFLQLLKFVCLRFHRDHQRLWIGGRRQHSSRWWRWCCCTSERGDPENWSASSKIQRSRRGFQSERTKKRDLTSRSFLTLCGGFEHVRVKLYTRLQTCLYVVEENCRFNSSQKEKKKKKKTNVKKDLKWRPEFEIH